MRFCPLPTTKPSEEWNKLRNVLYLPSSCFHHVPPFIDDFPKKKPSFIDRCHVWFPEGTPGWRPKKIKKSRVPGFSPGLRESVCWFYRCFFPLKPAWQLVIQILGLVVKPPHRNVWFLESKKKWWPPERSIYYVWYNWSARSIQLRILMWCILLFFTSGPSEENPQFDFHHL